MDQKLEIGDICRVTVRKFDPSRDDEPYYKTYEVPYTREMRVLEALDYIVEELGDSLAYQWYCGVKKCGGCAMRVNGKPVLACWEPAQREMLIEPLENLPIIRDLVVDRTRYEKNLIRIVPKLHRGEEYPGFPEHLTPQMMGHSIEMMHCIECLICLSVCPAYSENSEFIGPAPLVQLARFALDPRDAAPRAELAVTQGEIGGCVSCYECTEACPTGINVLEHAVDPLRELVTHENLGDVAHHNKVFKTLVLKQGIVNPGVLMVRSRGLRVISELGLALQMWLRGRISILKVLRGLLKLDHLDSQQELIKLEKTVHEHNNRKVQT